MSKLLKAKYDAAHNALQLVEPLEGVPNEADLEVTVQLTPHPHQWAALRSMVTQEQLDELAAIIEEEFPTDR
jgi:hypothetical protein